MKAVVVVQPAYLRVVEGEEDRVEVVLPGSTVGDIVHMKKRLVGLLEDKRPDVMITINFPGSPKVEIVSAEKVKDVVSA